MNRLWVIERGGVGRWPWWYAHQAVPYGYGYSEHQQVVLVRTLYAGVWWTT